MTDMTTFARAADPDDVSGNRPLGRHRLSPAKAAAVRTAPPLVMDLKEASAYLVCSPRKLRDLVAARRMRHARVGAKIVIRREWLDAFLER